MPATVIEFPRREASRRGIFRTGSGIDLSLMASRVAQAATEQPSATISLHHVQVSILLSAGWGDGTLRYQGHAHTFRLRGLGVIGAGVATIDASSVYNLHDLSDFPGLYGPLEAGAVAGNKHLLGGLWVQNPSGVRLNLRTTRQGLSLNAGCDGILIEFSP